MIKSGKASHKGMVRSLNEDSFLSLELSLEEGGESVLFGLYAVADGVGGCEGGEIASSLALKVLAAGIIDSLLLPALQLDSTNLTQESILQRLGEGVKRANSEVYLEGQAEGSDMSTTLAVALVINKTVYVANVGDSRVYLSDEGQLRQMTNDHSFVASLVAVGEITPEEIYTHPYRHIITRCLGTQGDVEVDLFTEELRPGDSLLLCSDGLWEMVKDNKIKEVLLQSSSPQSACEQLIELANENGGVDNISAVIVKVTQ
jgi:serine/threonine protein phosphatase PrpC